MDLATSFESRACNLETRVQTIGASIARGGKGIGFSHRYSSIVMRVLSVSSKGTGQLFACHPQAINPQRRCEHLDEIPLIGVVPTSTSGWISSASLAKRRHSASTGARVSSGVVGLEVVNNGTGARAPVPSFFCVAIRENLAIRCAPLAVAALSRFAPAMLRKKL